MILANSFAVAWVTEPILDLEEAKMDSGKSLSHS